jgi:hypothetical protein
MEQEQVQTNKETTGTYNTFIGALSGTNGVYNWFNRNRVVQQ